jgi:hypothetical protein
MQKYDPVEFVVWAVWYANQRESHLTPIRIVKFLYLADLFNARVAGGHTLSGWQWRFVHYGPFCREALDAISAAESREFILSETFKSKFDKDGRSFRFIGENAPEDFPESLSVYVCSEIKRAVELWADDTYGLLNHVYFNTEPMAAALPYQILDFATAQIPQRDSPVEMAPLSKKKLNKARDLLKELGKIRQEQKAKTEKRAVASLYDESYDQAMRLLEEEAGPLEFGGTLDLKS